VEWLALAEELAASGKQIVLSTLALIEAEAELSVLDRQIAHGGFWIEANDLSAVQLCKEKGRPFVAGPSLNVYNHRALAMLMDDGLRRWVPGVEQGRSLIDDLKDGVLADGNAMPELEVIGWGRLPLSYSARCFTARALDVPKDQCGFRCIDYPDGMPLATREGRPFLRINGISVQGEEITDLGPELPELRTLGVDILRLYPQAEGMDAIVQHFDAARQSSTPPARIGERNGYWYGEAGMRMSA
jgi:collagenase-like PrtC family protease